MTGRAHSVVAAVAAIAAAIALSACDVPAAGKPVLYADQVAAAETDGNPVFNEADYEPEEAGTEEFSPVESVGEGSVSLRLENHLGATITSVSLRSSGVEGWPGETAYTGLSIPNGSRFELFLSASADERIDFKFEGADGTTFLEIGSMPAFVATDNRPDGIIMLRYDNGVVYVEYTSQFGFTVDTHLSAQEAFESMREQLDERTETFTFTERDMEGVEAGQETENCLD